MTKIKGLIEELAEGTLDSRQEKSRLLTDRQECVDLQKLMRRKELAPLTNVAMQPWRLFLKYHSQLFTNFDFVRIVLGREEASAQQILASHGAVLQGGLAKLWRGQTLDAKVSKRYIDRQNASWKEAYPNGLQDAKMRIEGWFAERELMQFLTFKGTSPMAGQKVAQPNKVGAGGHWLVFQYEHPTAQAATEALHPWSSPHFHGSPWYGAQNVLKCNRILPSASAALGHRNAHYKGPPGVYTSPHMYTAMFYADAQVLFQDGVYFRVLYQVAVHGREMWHKAAHGNQYVFPSENIRITHVWVQPYADIQKSEYVHVSWNPLLECIEQPFSPRTTDVSAALSSGIFVEKKSPTMKGSVLHMGSSSGSSSSGAPSGGQAQAIEANEQRQVVPLTLFDKWNWEIITFFNALAELRICIQKERPFENIAVLQKIELCLDLVSLEATDEDKEYGLETGVLYKDVLEALASVNKKKTMVDQVHFRNRPLEIQKLLHMLFALVAKGINRYLHLVELQHGEQAARMTLHLLCYWGCTTFALNNLDCIWISKEAAHGDQTHAIKFRVYPKEKKNTRKSGQRHTKLCTRVTGPNENVHTKLCTPPRTDVSGMCCQ